MQQKGEGKISQCMIVKNEEKNIERALCWGKEVVAEQIVVDTGSTDRTVEIAERLGARVYHFPWINDFAAAKNFAIEKAQYPWIAFLDADEYFSVEDGRKLADLLEKIPSSVDAVMTAWIHLYDNGTIMQVDSQTRIFRNCPEIRYHGRIHETFSRSDGKRLETLEATDQLSIFHTGYGEEAEEKKKASKRNLLLIQEELKDNPNNFQMQAYLGNEYLTFGEYDLAEKAYRKAISLLPEQFLGYYSVVTSGVFSRLLNILTTRPGNHEMAIVELYRQASFGWPKEADYDYLLGDYYTERGNFVEGERYFKQALQKLDKYGNSEYSSKLSAKIMHTYELLMMCCLNNGNFGDCVKYGAAILKENPYLMTIAMLFISAFHRDMMSHGRQKEGAEEVAALLGRSFYHLQSLKDRIFILRAAMDAGWGELVEVIRGLFSPEEMEQVDRGLGKKG